MEYSTKKIGGWAIIVRPPFDGNDLLVFLFSLKKGFGKILTYISKITTMRFILARVPPLPQPTASCNLILPPQKVSRSLATFWVRETTGGMSEY